jgi:hypothetical protein
MDSKSGGVSQAIINIIEGLSELGVTNEIISLESPAKSLDNITVHNLGPCKGPWAYNKYFEKWLSNNIANYNVIIIHGMWLYHGYIVRKVNKQIVTIRNKKLSCSENRGCEFYLMPHGMLDPYFQNAPGRKIKAIRNRIYWNLIERQARRN